MTAHQKAVNEIRNFLLKQLEENQQAELDRANIYQEDDEARFQHLRNAGQYRRRIDKMKRSFN